MKIVDAETVAAPDIGAIVKVEELAN